MPDEHPSDPACGVCGRRLLPGERAIAFLTRDGEEIEVCELCKPRAEAADWSRPEDVAATGGATAGREQRRSRGAQVFGGLWSRRQAEDDDRNERVERPPRRSSASEPEAAGEADHEGEPEPPIAPTGTTVADAVAAFNRSDHRRTVAGLTRTLGEPRASALLRKGNGEGERVRLTIAWELTWYQWEVAVSGRGHEVRESGKGDTIDQLGSADRSWNLMAAADGTLDEKTSATTPVEEG